MGAILARANWTIVGCPLLLKRWEPGITFASLEPRKLPVWIKLRNVPSDMFHANGLSFIASRFGKPLFTDSMTATWKHLAFARVCVELEALKSLERSLTIILPYGKEIVIDAEYEFYPPRCFSCLVFGHSDAKCLQNRADNTSAPFNAGLKKQSKRDNGKKKVEAVHSGVSQDLPGSEPSRPNLDPQVSSAQHCDAKSVSQGVSPVPGAVGPPHAPGKEVPL